MKSCFCMYFTKWRRIENFRISVTEKNERHFLFFFSKTCVFVVTKHFRSSVFKNRSRTHPNTTEVSVVKRRLPHLTLWHIRSKQELWSHNSRPLLGSGP
jgi:hypothetical protein